MLLNWDEITDVVVIGSGFAGLSAAIEANNADASVIILEKMNAPGGNSIISDGGIAAAGTKMQKILGIDLVIAPNMNETLYEIEVVKVLKLVARFFNIPYRILTSKSRKREYVDARRIAINICKARNVQDSVISRVAKMDHSTVVFHKKKFIELCETDKKFIKMFDDADEFVTNHFKYDNQ